MHCKSYSHFFSKKFQHICVSLVNFNESLINNVVSFEQLCPGGAIKLTDLIVLFNMSTLVDHFVSSPKEWEKRGRRDSRGEIEDSRGDEREGQGRKRKMNESEETEKLKPFYQYLLEG